MTDITARIMVTLIITVLSPIICALFCVFLLAGTIHAVWTEKRHNPADDNDLY